MRSRTSEWYGCQTTRLDTEKGSHFSVARSARRPPRLHGGPRAKFWRRAARVVSKARPRAYCVDIEFCAWLGAVPRPYGFSVKPRTRRLTDGAGISKTHDFPVARERRGWRSSPDWSPIAERLALLGRSARKSIAGEADCRHAAGGGGLLGRPVTLPRG